MRKSFRILKAFDGYSEGQVATFGPGMASILLGIYAITPCKDEPEQKPALAAVLETKPAPQKPLSLKASKK